MVRNLSTLTGGGAPLDNIHTGIETDQSLIKSLYSDAHVICSADFMKVSEDSYPLPWLIRELAQNFVDANPAKNKGTLNGVQIERENFQDGGVRFRIKGNWSFDSPEGLIGLHSGKTTGVHAGGNGIGLKQTVLRFMRDFEVDHFTIQGERWEVRYEILTAANGNAALKEQGHADQKFLKHDWLIAHTQSSANKGKNAYTLQTKNEKVIQAMGTFF